MPVSLSFIYGVITGVGILYILQTWIGWYLNRRPGISDTLREDWVDFEAAIIEVIEDTQQILAPTFDTQWYEYHIIWKA